MTIKRRAFVSFVHSSNLELKLSSQRTAQTQSNIRHFLCYIASSKHGLEPIRVRVTVHELYYFVTHSKLCKFVFGCSKLHSLCTNLDETANHLHLPTKYMNAWQEVMAFCRQMFLSDLQNLDYEFMGPLYRKDGVCIERRRDFPYALQLGSNGTPAKCGF